MTNRDKLVERDRYDGRAREQLSRSMASAFIDDSCLGWRSMPVYLQQPYIYYERKISELISARSQVLELGAGMGSHTRAILQTGAQAIISDISPNCLKYVRRLFESSFGNFRTEVADIENLPFDDEAFEVVVCAGSLSYGAPNLVDAGISRVLRPGGMLICVDSLNHNPVYRANRWLHYMRGNRSLSTLSRMPDLARIRSLSKGFSSVDVRFFGAVSYAMPGISRLFGEQTARALSDRIDELVGVRRSAFKFVLVAQGLA